MAKQKHITLDIFDYSRKKLCSLFDSTINAKGQAYDISVITEGNGWKEIEFSLPYLISQARNFRWNFIKSEYYVRYSKNGKTDWFIIHAPKRLRNAKAITNTVRCSHISAELKTKNLYLTFDDTNGIDTAPNLLDRALKGTGWTRGECDTFFESDGKTEKIRSMKSEGKAGAYKLITTICDLFNAYPDFDGENKRVSLRSMNNRGALRELVVGKNINTLSVEYNSEDIITRLYVEGEYGDFGYVGIDDINPTGLNFLLDFGYYKEIGMFTNEHQQALDTYITDMKRSTSEITA